MLKVWEYDEIYLGGNKEESLRVRKLLLEKGIKFSHRSVKYDASNKWKKRLGKLGKKLIKDNEYYVYVPKDQVEEIKELIEKTRDLLQEPEALPEATAIQQESIEPASPGLGQGTDPQGADEEL